MKAELHETSNLHVMAKELAEVASRYQANQDEGIQLKVYSNYGDDWDEIYVISEDINTGEKYQVVRVTVGKLSKKERAQLSLQVEMYNETTAACAA